MELLLVGEDIDFVRRLSVELALSGFAVSLATDGAACEAALASTSPDIVIFDHVEPLDLLLLNPRNWGYTGPILLLIRDDVPLPTLELLRGPRILRKPFEIDVLLEQLTFVTGARS